MDRSRTVTDIIADIAARDSGRPRKRVAVLGAGMAGLVAAYELSSLGHAVVVYEASDRVGGRAWTHYFKSGAHHELGAMRIPKSHHFTRHYAIDVCGLSLRPFINHHDRTERSYHFKGITTTHAQSKVRLLSRYKLSPREKAFLADGDKPVIALMAPLAEVTDEIKQSPGDLAALFLRGPMTDRVRELERMTLGDFMRAAWDTEAALELLGCVTGLEVWWDKAITMFIRDSVVEDGSQLDEIVGGTSALPEALRKLLVGRGVPILLERPVQAIHARKSEVQLVVGEPADTERLDSPFALCTIPFSVLRRISLTGVSDDKLSAVRNLTYASSTKVLLDCPVRFWEANGVVGGGSQLDLINRQVYYPSDGHPEEPGVEEGSQSVQGGVTKRVRLAPKTPGKGPAALVGSYVWGADARRLAAMDRDERVRVVRECVGHIHPEILQPGAVTTGESMAWDEYPWSAGAFCFTRPGDVERYYNAGRRREGRLFFAGEHCSLTQAWIQGAVESALEAVREIVSE